MMKVLSLDDRSFLCRRVLGAVCGLLGLTVVMTGSLPNALISLKLVPAAGFLPMGAAVAARSADFRNLTPALSLRALQISPLVPPALTRIAQDLPSRRADPMVQLAGKLGWRDLETQRQLYISALSRGDCPAALLSASALLRQGVGFAQLGPVLVRATALTECQPAMLALLRQGEPWAPAWLRRYGAAIDPVMLTRILAIVRPARETWVPIIGKLLSAGQTSAAYAIWQQASPQPVHKGELEWPRPEAILYPTIFDWSLSSGMTINNGSPNEASPGSAATTLAVRQFVLVPGSYLLSIGRPQDVAQNWRWGLSCGPEAAAPTETMRIRQVFKVDARCSAPWLALAGGEGPIAALTLRRLPDPVSGHSQ